MIVSVYYSDRTEMCCAQGQPGEGARAPVRDVPGSHDTSHHWTIDGTHRPTKQIVLVDAVLVLELLDPCFVVVPHVGYRSHAVACATVARRQRLAQHAAQRRRPRRRCCLARRVARRQVQHLHVEPASRHIAQPSSTEAAVSVLDDQHLHLEMRLEHEPQSCGDRVRARDAERACCHSRPVLLLLEAHSLQAALLAHKHWGEAHVPRLREQLTAAVDQELECCRVQRLVHGGVRRVDHQRLARRQHDADLDHPLAGAPLDPVGAHLAELHVDLHGRRRNEVVHRAELAFEFERPTAVYRHVRIARSRRGERQGQQRRVRVGGHASERVARLVHVAVLDGDRGIDGEGR